MTSHPSPFFRQRQSTKALDPTGQTAKFLYTILKQLDLKNIDWNEVASNLDITNGHAARMRWSRFRAQIEGLDNSYSRKGGKKKESEKKRKNVRGDDAESSRVNSQTDESLGLKRLKLERGLDVKTEPGRDLTTCENSTNLYAGGIKKEHEGGTTVIDGVAIHHPTIKTIQVPQSPSQQSNHSYQSHHAVSSNPSHSNVQSMQPMHMQGIRPPYNTQTGYIHNQWPHHPNMAYSYPPRSNMVSPGYYQPATLPPNPYQYPVPFTNQPQQRPHYAPHTTLFQHYQTRPFRHGDLNPTMQASRNIATSTPLYSSQMPPPPPSRSQHPDTFNQGPTSLTQPRAQTPVSAGSSKTIVSMDNKQLQVNACQQASEASYPWPYSEASLPQFTQPNTNASLSKTTVELPTTSESLASGLEMDFDGIMDSVLSNTEHVPGVTDVSLSNTYEQSNAPTAAPETGISSGTIDKANNTAANAEMSTTPAISVSTKCETIVKTEPDLL